MKKRYVGADRKTKAHLVDEMDGVFGITRSPMYLGFVLLLAGAAMLKRSVPSWIVVIAFAAALDRVYVRVEERMVAEKFGEPWESYRKRVRRWL